MFWYSWSSPISIGVFLAGLNLLFWGLSCGTSKTKKKN